MTPQTTSGSLFGLGALTSALQGFGQYQSGQQQKAADDYNAQITLDNMADQVAANEDQTAVTIGKQASAYAASGVDITSGSPLLIMMATAARGAQKGQQIQESGTEEAALQKYYGKIAAFSGTMGGINTFLSGFTKAATGYYGATSKTPSPSASMSPIPEGVMG